MLYNATQKVIQLSGGREIVIETGKLAKQADGSVVVKQGNTMLLATVVAAKEPKPDCDFMPLSVEYKEKYAAAGRFPGGFLKREARPSDYEILVSRLIDRALRPAVPFGFPRRGIRTGQPHLGRQGHYARRAGRTGRFGRRWPYRTCRSPARSPRCALPALTASW